MTSDWPAYPPDDIIPYLTWFGVHFSSVFVATIPFLRLPHRGADHSQVAVSAPLEAKAKPNDPSECVSWSAVADACNFPTIAHINRALRFTGSKRVKPSLASPADTQVLLTYCRAENLIVPCEGWLPPALQASIADFADAAACQNISVASHFGISQQTISVAKLREAGNGGFAEILAPDRSFFMTIYTDFHYLLICQTAACRAAVDPTEHFEGFFADAQTNDYWGIGDLTP